MIAPECPLCRSSIVSYRPSIREGTTAPAVGDVVICNGCAGYLRFDSAMRLALISEPHLAQIDDDFRLLMDLARDALVDKWLASDPPPPTIFAWTHCEVRRRKLAGEL